MLPYMLERVETITQELKKILWHGGPIDTKGYPSPIEVDRFGYAEGDRTYAEAAALTTSAWSDFPAGSRWGGCDMNAWFRCTVTIPPELQGWPVIALFSTGREGLWNALNPQLLAFVNGVARQGLDTNHQEVLLTESARAGETYELMLQAWSGMAGEHYAQFMNMIGDGDGTSTLHLLLMPLDRELESLYYNLHVPMSIAKALGKDDQNAIVITEYLNRAIDQLDLRRPYNPQFIQSVKAANAYLATEFYGRACGHSNPVITAVGHTHIDVAWLWRLCHTRKKTARTFASMLELMDQYPDFIFMSSQPQLYQYLKEDHPDLYARVKQRVKEGRWEPDGGMWLEADCNVTSGESLVRQLLYGIRFFRDEFGMESTYLWLPDVFGYSAALPQILQKSNIPTFMTTKISWNQFNKMPYDTFMWEGIDGSKVLSHFISAEETGDIAKGKFMTTYNGLLNAELAIGTWKRYQQKDITNDVLMSMGYGDGGGGTTRAMIETTRRMGKGIPGCPRMQFGTAGGYFKRLKESAEKAAHLPTWVGELYLEFHRGTYTSMARNKRNNRLSEFLYGDAECLSAIAMLQGASYPKAMLDDGWRTILLNQFHDILPGSSIHEVYEDCDVDYARVLGRGRKMLGEAAGYVADRVALTDRSVIVFNTLSFPRTGIVKVELPEGWGSARVMDGADELPSQRSACGCNLIFEAHGVPAKGYKAFRLDQGIVTVKNELSVSETAMENSFYRITLDRTGAIVSLFDKRANREVLKAGERGNVIQVFEDKPMAHDAWDIDIYYSNKMWELDQVTSIEVVEQGPARARLRISKRFLESTWEQDIVIYRDIPRIDFENHVDWKERQLLVKAAFPVDVHANEATYEIHYGNVTRPTHWNTSWDWARFEVCGQKWADLSEDDYGVSLMNDCKYGYDIKDGVMRLTLLKSAIAPNWGADREKHVFTYALYPHEGTWKQADTVSLAYDLNVGMPCVAREAQQGSLPGTWSMVSLSAHNVFADVVKRAEDSDDIILRVYECHNRRTEVTATLGMPVSRVEEVNLLEEASQPVSCQGNVFSFSIKPYEIKTFKIVR